jgi:hypothetical protein
METLLKALPDIIKNASQSGLGILALLTIIVGGLAWGFFNKAPVNVRIAIWSLILVGTIGFFIATANASHDVKILPAIQPTTDALSVAGTIVDADSQTAIEHAQISFEGRSETTVFSDHYGKFRLEPSGKASAQADVELRASMVGYDTYDSWVRPPLGGFVIPLHRSK